MKAKDMIISILNIFSDIFIILASFTYGYYVGIWGNIRPDVNITPGAWVTGVVDVFIVLSIVLRVSSKLIANWNKIVQYIMKSYKYIQDRIRMR